MFSLFCLPNASTEHWGGGAVAQLGERLVCNQEATGSIPVSSTRIKSESLLVLLAANNLMLGVNRGNRYKYRIRSYRWLLGAEHWVERRHSRKANALENTQNPLRRGAGNRSQTTVFSEDDV